MSKVVPAAALSCWISQKGAHNNCSFTLLYIILRQLVYGQVGTVLRYKLISMAGR